MRTFLTSAFTVVGLALAPAAQADVVTDWAEFGNAIDANDDSPWSPELYFAQTQLALAMFEAANAIDRKFESYLGLEAGESDASVDAAVITAARDVLVTRYPARKQDVEYSYELALSMITDQSARDKGIAIGQRAAEAALATAKVDPNKKAPPYRPLTAPGVWVPVQLPSLRDDYRILPLWAINSVADYMPPPPPSMKSEIWTRDFNEVKRLGGRNSAERTSVQSRIARYRITPVIFPTLSAIADMPGRSTVQNARMLALFKMAGDDTEIVTSNAKLDYNFWRPLTAIRNADQDGNPDTEIDPDWAPFIGTPNFPEYPCAHCSWSATVAEVLKAEVGNSPPGGVQVGSRSLDFAATQVVPTFDQWVSEVSFSRTLGGVHYRFSNEAGEALGRKVARETLKLMPPIEE